MIKKKKERKKSLQQETTSVLQSPMPCKSHSYTEPPTEVILCPIKTSTIIIFPPWGDTAPLRASGHMHLRWRPFLQGRAANLAHTWVATGNLAAGTCCCSCRPSFPVGKHQKAFCEVGCRAQCWERSSFWCPVSKAGGWEETQLFLHPPFWEQDFWGALVKRSVATTAQVAIAFPASSVFSSRSGIWVRRHVPLHSQGDANCSATSLFLLCCQGCHKPTWALNPPWTGRGVVGLDPAPTPGAAQSTEPTPGVGVCYF